MAAIIVSMSFPVGVPVSRFSLLLTRCTPLAYNCSTISSRSLVLRARRLVLMVLFMVNDLSLDKKGRDRYTKDASRPGGLVRGSVQR